MGKTLDLLDAKGLREFLLTRCTVSKNGWKTLHTEMTCGILKGVEYSEGKPRNFFKSFFYEGG